MNGAMRLMANAYSKRSTDRKPAENADSDKDTRPPSGADRVRAGVAEAASTYRARDSNAAATCLILSKTNFGKEGDAGNNMSVSLLLMKMTRAAKGHMDNSMTTTDGSICIPPYAKVFWKQAIADKDKVEEVYAHAQIVLGLLDSDRRAAGQRVKNEKANRYMDEQGTFHPELAVIPMMLQSAKLSEYARTHYLPNCQLGNVPSYAKNGLQSDKSTSTFVATPADGGEWRTMAEDLLQNERCANLVAYIIHLIAKYSKLENAVYIRPGQTFEISIEESPSLRPRSIVEVGGISCSTSIDPLAITFKEGSNEIDEKIVPTTRIRAGGVTPNKQRPTCFQPFVILCVSSMLNLCNSTLLSVEALARQLELDPEATRLAKQLKAKPGAKKPDDFSMPMRNMFFIPGIDLRATIEDAALNPENYDEASLVSLEPRIYEDGDEANPWCTKKVDATATAPKKPSKQQVDLTITGYQFERRLTERIGPNSGNANRANVDNNILSQAMDDSSDEVEYKVFYEELTRIGGTLGSMGESLIDFGLQESETSAWKALAPLLFSLIQGSVVGYIKYFKSLAIAPNVKSEMLTTEEASFLTSHSVEDPVTGRKYMKVKEHELSYAIDIMQVCAPVTVVYNAMAKNWLFNYAAVISRVGIQVSRETAKQFLKLKKRPQFKPLPPSVLNNGGVYLVNDEGSLPKEEDDTVQYRIVYPNGIPKDKVEMTRMLEIIETVTPAISNIIIKSDYATKKAAEKLALFKHANVEADMDDLNLLTPMIGTGDGYLYIIPKDHKKSVEADIESLLSFFAAPGAGTAATAVAIEAGPAAPGEKEEKNTATATIATIAKDNSAGKITEMTDDDDNGNGKKRKASEMTPPPPVNENSNDGVSDTQPFVEDAPAAKRAKLNLEFDAEDQS
jgi:hypothetical protein